MKRCPRCHQTYTDETLKFCRDDGTPLQADNLPAESSDTLILPAARPSGALPTRLLQYHSGRAEETGSPLPSVKTTQTGELNATGDTHSTSSAEYIAQEVKKHKRGFAVALVFLLSAVIGMGYWYFFHRSSSVKQIESIAVMPFVNESGNADNEYLSDGMTETLINSLSQIPNLSVKARSSVFRYKGKELDLKKIASELNVQAILNGRVVQRGDQLTLSLELIDAQTENVIWSESYNRRQADLVSLQSEIARDVSSKLKTKLSGAEVAKLTKSYTSNPEAYQLYLKGRYHSTKYTEEGFNKGIEYFNQAIALDPNYALAYDGLAYSYYANWYIPAKEGAAKGKAAAAKALEIDPTLAEAHASIATIYAWFDYNWEAAEREFRQSINLNPNYGLAHANYGIYLAAMGRFHEAISEAKRAVELEPLSAEYNTILGIVYFYAKRYDEAASQFNKTIEFEPNFWWAHTFLARTHEMSGKLPAAISELEGARRMQGATIEVLAALGHAYAVSGKRDEAQRIIAELKEPDKQVQADGYEFAVVYTALGDKQQAFEYLDKEYAAGGWFLNFLKVEPYFDSLRDDPRFKELLKRVNLPE